MICWTSWWRNSALRVRLSASDQAARTLLENERGNLLAFAVEMDRELATLAQEWQISVEDRGRSCKSNSCRRGTRSGGVARRPCEKRCVGVITACVPMCRSSPIGLCGPAVR